MNATELLDREVREVQVPGNRLVFHLEGVSVELRSVEGGLEIFCDQPIRFRSRTIVEIGGDEGVRITGPGGRLEIGARETQLSADVLRVRTKEAELEGDRLTARAREANVAWGKLEQVVGRLWTVAKNAYVRIEGLLHERAGRVRMESGGSMLFQAREARIQAKEDVRVQGRSINLG